MVLMGCQLSKCVCWKTPFTKTYFPYFVKEVIFVVVRELLTIAHILSFGMVVVIVLHFNLKWFLHGYINGLFLCICVCVYLPINMHRSVCMCTQVYSVYINSFVL
jgi:hypothetical protein